MKSVCVFCGSSSGMRPVFRQAAIEMGREIIRRGLKLVYGGGNVGLMGTIADTVMAEGGYVIGVIPSQLMERELGHHSVSELHVVNTMHQRKQIMAESADGYIAMPGGFGTFEEFCEMLTWSQLGIHAKPCGILNIEGYYDSLLALFDHAVEEGFLKPENRAMVLAADDPARLLDLMREYSPIRVEKWMDEYEA